MTTKTCRPSVDDSATATIELDFDNPHDMIDVGHSRLAHWKIGSGPDLVFVHGWPIHSATFREIAPRLAQHFTCHLIDLPGAGRTEWTDGTPVSLLHNARTLRIAIEQLGLARYGLIAHDSGGVIARLVAAKHADRVVGLVLEGTEIPDHHPWLVGLYLKLQRIPGWRSVMRLMLGSRILRHSAIGFGSVFSDKSLIDGDFYDYFIAPLIDSERAAEGQSLLANDFDWSVIDDLREVHAEISAPVQLIWGPDDPFFPAKKARAMAEQFAGGAEFHELSTGRLFAHEELPHEFTHLAEPFLQRCFT